MYTCISIKCKKHTWSNGSSSSYSSDSSPDVLGRSSADCTMKKKRKNEKQKSECPSLAADAGPLSLGPRLGSG